MCSVYHTRNNIILCYGYCVHVRARNDMRHETLFWFLCFHDLALYPLHGGRVRGVAERRLEKSKFKVGSCNIMPVTRRVES